jgi:hypothetical protein
MKTLTKTLVILFVGVFTLACVRTPAINITKDLQQYNHIILEVDYFITGGMSGVVGRVSSVRIYENGFVEYEAEDDNKLNEHRDEHAQFFSEEVVTRKEETLDENEIKEIIELINSKEFQKTTDYFKNREGFCTCGSSRLEIRARNSSRIIKNITIDGAGCDDLTQPREKIFPRFPPILSKLIKQIRDSERKISS